MIGGSDHLLCVEKNQHTTEVQRSLHRHVIRSNEFYVATTRSHSTNRHYEVVLGKGR